MKKEKLKYLPKLKQNILTYNPQHPTSNTAITLIALILTIIILLILSTICLTMLLGDNGIISKAQIAKEKTNNAQENEKANLQDIDNKIDEYSTITNRNNSDISPDYSSKIDIESYSSSTNQYTAPCSGYILIPSFALSYGSHLACYINDFRVSWNSNSNSVWYRDSICLPISANSTFYYTLSGGSDICLLDYGVYFIPNN